MLMFRNNSNVYLFLKKESIKNSMSSRIIKAFNYGTTSLFGINYVNDVVEEIFLKVKTQEIRLLLKNAFKENRPEGIEEILINYEKDDFKKISSEMFFIILSELYDVTPFNLLVKIWILCFKKIKNSKNVIKAFFKNEKSNEEVLILMENILNDDLDQDSKADFILYTYNKHVSIICKNNSNDEIFNFNQIFIENYKNILNDQNIKIIYKNLSKILLKYIELSDFNNFSKLLNNVKYFKDNISDIFFNKLLDNISKLTVVNKLEFIDLIIENMKTNEIKFTNITLNTIMDIFSSQGNVEKCIEIFFNDFKKNEIDPDNYSYSIIIKSLKNNQNFDYLMAIKFFNVYKNSGLKKDIIMYNSILDLLISKNKIKEAEELFEEMLNNDDYFLDNITFNIMIKSCIKFYKKDIKKPLYYKNKMIEKKIEPNIITLNTLLDILVKNYKFDMIFDILDEMKRFKINPDKYTYSTILNGLKTKNSNIKYIKMVLNKLKFYISNLKFNFDEVLFNSILDTCIFHNLKEEFTFFYELMDNLNVKKTSITNGIWIKGFSNFKDFEKSFEIYNTLIKNKEKINDKLIGSIIGAYIKNGNIEKAIEIYDNLENNELKNNSSIFTQIIKGFFNIKKLNKSIEFFNEIKEKTNVKGILITYNCMLDIYIKSKMYDESNELFEEIKKKFVADIFTYSSIIKKYINNNEKVKIIDILKEMVSKNVSIDSGLVNIILDSCSNKFDYDIAFTIFKYINTISYKPNEITFGIMIKICGFAKKVEYGFEMFDSLKFYGIDPSIIIYTNLIHISFGNRDFKSVERAFNLFRLSNLKGDNLLFEKLVNGFLRFRKFKEAKKYAKICTEYKCFLKEDTLDNLNNNENQNTRIFKNNKYQNNNYQKYNGNKKNNGNNNQKYTKRIQA